MKTFQQIGTEIGAPVEEKNAAYGSSFAASGKFLALLYPDGLQPEQFGTALLLVRMFDKMMRIATDKDAFGESPFRDLAGYGILGAYLDQERKDPCIGSASGAIAPSESKEQPASVPAASDSTTTPANGSSESSSTQRSKEGSDDSCAISMLSVVPAAEAISPASGSGDGLQSLNPEPLVWKGYEVVRV